MVKKYKLIIIFFWIIILILLLVTQFIDPRLFYSLIYWWVLLGWLFLIRQLKIDSRITFLTAMILFLVSATTTVLNFKFLAEIIMSLTFTGLMIGFVQAFIEYKKSGERNSL